MGKSLQELKAALESYGGFTQTVNSLQDLKNLLNNLGAVRETTVEDDIGQDISGVLCTGHSFTSYLGGLSLQQISDASVNLRGIQCEELIGSDPYCSARTATTDNVGCTCAARTSTAACACNGDYCGARCNCAGRTVSFGVQPECGCDGRSLTCSCEARTCSYDCSCNIYRNCESRTAVYDYLNCTCASRTLTAACQCNTRCSCNAVTKYA